MNLYFYFELKTGLKTLNYPFNAGRDWGRDFVVGGVVKRSSVKALRVR